MDAKKHIGEGLFEMLKAVRNLDEQTRKKAEEKIETYVQGIVDGTKCKSQEKAG